MSTVRARDLRTHTADVRRQVSGGTTVTITVDGLPVAEISPVRSARRQFLTKAGPRVEHLLPGRPHVARAT